MWREIFPSKVLSRLWEWMFFPSRSTQESKEKLQKHWDFWERHCRSLLSFWLIEEKVRCKIESSRVPPLKSSFRRRWKEAINPLRKQFLSSFFFSALQPFLLYIFFTFNSNCLNSYSILYMSIKDKKAQKQRKIKRSIFFTQ